jgi:hypothetical protein
MCAGDFRVRSCAVLSLYFEKKNYRTRCGLFALLPLKGKKIRGECFLEKKNIKKQSKLKKNQNKKKKKSWEHNGAEELDLNQRHWREV